MPPSNIIFHDLTKKIRGNVKVKLPTRKAPLAKSRKQDLGKWYPICKSKDQQAFAFCTTPVFGFHDSPSPVCTSADLLSEGHNEQSHYHSEVYPYNPVSKVTSLCSNGE